MGSLYVEPCFGQQKQETEISSLNNVPTWVKEKVTLQEYELWKKMSSVFCIDYSFLCESGKWSSDSRKALYDIVGNMCADIDKGLFKEKVGSYFSVPATWGLPADTTHIWKVCELIQIDENIQFCKRKAIVYQSKYCPDIRLKCSIWYIDNILNKDVTIIKFEFSTSTFTRFEGIGNVIYQGQNSHKINGSFAGYLYYYDKKGKLCSEKVEKMFAFSLNHRM